MTAEPAPIDPPTAKERFVTALGEWPPGFEHLVQLDPDFVDACREFLIAATGAGSLDPKVRSFIRFALEISVTHPHRDNARIHAASALRHGATLAELVDVCELVSLLGIHTMTMAVPILAQELAAAGQPVPSDLTPAQQEIRERYVADRGLFPPPLEPLLALHPEFVNAYRRLSSIPVRRGHLDPKVIELIVIALDASTTHLNASGTAVHIRKALALGASAAEILEVLELTSEQGVHGTQLGAEIVAELNAIAPPRHD